MQKIDDNSWFLEQEARCTLAWSAGPGRGISQKLMLDLATAPCLRLGKDGSVTLLTCTGRTTIEGLVCALFPSREKDGVQSLRSCILEDFGLFLELLGRAASQDKHTFEMEPSLTLVTPDAYYVPGHFAGWRRTSSFIGKKNQYVQRELAIETYKLLSGNKPYSGESGVDTSWAQNKGLVDEIVVNDMVLDDTLAQFLYPTLRSLTWEPSPESWVAAGLVLRSGKQFRPSRPDEQEKLKRRNNFRSKGGSFVIWWQRFWLRVVIGVAVGLALLSIPTTIILKKLEPPVTAGLNARQLVEAFYKGVGELDTELVEDALLDKGVSKYAEAVSNLSVVSKMRMVTERLDPVLPAMQWNSTWLPVSDQVMVWGPTKLRFTEWRDTEDGGAELVLTYIWYEDRAEKPGLRYPVSEYRRDRVVVSRRGKYLYISEQERLDEAK